MKTAKLFKRIPSFSGTPVEFDDESGRAINYIDEQLDFQAIGMDSQIGLKFIAGFGPIVDDQAASRRLYSEDLGIEFDEFEGGYMHAKKIDGCKGFALWPLSMAAEDCFGTRTWPDDIPDLRPGWNLTWRISRLHQRR